MGTRPRPNCPALAVLGALFVVVLVAAAAGMIDLMIVAAAVVAVEKRPKPDQVNMMATGTMSVMTRMRQARFGQSQIPV